MARSPSITALRRASCTCGRSHPRLQRIAGATGGSARARGEGGEPGCRVRVTVGGEGWPGLGMHGGVRLGAEAPVHLISIYVADMARKEGAGSQPYIAVAVEAGGGTHRRVEPFQHGGVGPASSRPQEAGGWPHSKVWRLAMGAEAGVKLLARGAELWPEEGSSGCLHSAHNSKGPHFCDCGATSVGIVCMPHCGPSPPTQDASAACHASKL